MFTNIFLKNKHDLCIIIFAHRLQKFVPGVFLRPGRVWVA